MALQEPNAGVDTDCHDCSKTGGSLWSASAPVMFTMDVDAIGYVAAALTTLIPASFVLQKKIRHHLNAGER